jgi:hypothetical protein
MTDTGAHEIHIFTHEVSLHEVQVGAWYAQNVKSIIGGVSLRPH